jgi:hypothetical protein
LTKLYNKKHYNTIKWLFSKKEFFMNYKEVTPIYKLTQPLRRPSLVLYQSYETYSKQIKDLLKKDNLDISLE